MTVDPAVSDPLGAVAGVDVDLIATAVRTCSLVAALHGGRFGEVATYLPGRRVRGVRITATAVEVHVVGRFPATMPDIAAQVRRTVAPWTAGRPVDVTIEDLVVGAEPFEEPAEREVPAVVVDEVVVVPTDAGTAVVIAVDTPSVAAVADPGDVAHPRRGTEFRES